MDMTVARADGFLLFSLNKLRRRPAEMVYLLFCGVGGLMFGRRFSRSVQAKSVLPFVQCVFSLINLHCFQDDPDFLCTVVSEILVFSCGCDVSCKSRSSGLMYVLAFIR